jgi:hypothetical protein
VAQRKLQAKACDDAKKLVALRSREWLLHCAAAVGKSPATASRRHRQRGDSLRERGASGERNGRLCDFEAGERRA